MVAHPHLLLRGALILGCAGQLFGCAGKGAEDTASVTALDGITTRRWSAVTGADGLHGVRLDVGEGDDALLVCARTERASRWLSVERIEDPDGAVVLRWQDWYEVPRVLTGGIFPSGADSCINWPVREEDEPLRPGVWRVWMASTDDRNRYAGGTPLEVVAQTREAPGDTGVLRVALAFAGDLSEEEGLVEAVELAVQRWADIWAPAGIALEVERVEVELDRDLPDLLEGGAAWTEAAARTDDNDVLMVIGETIGGSVDLYGLAGGVPGSLTEGPRAALAVSWLANAGRDGVFDEDEIQLLGDTLAHEAGHFAGLVHPVEDGWVQWDALDDTVECARMGVCEDVLGDNNLFPYAICSLSTCAPQDALTEDQVAVLRRYTGVH